MKHSGMGRRGAVRGFVVLCSGLGLLGLAGSAWANAPNPVAGTTQVDQVRVNPDGSRTVTVQGRWVWTTQTNCPAARNGVGYQVDWFDNTTNAIGGAKSPNGILYVGDGQDNIVHSIETLGGSSAEGNAFWDGVPSSYLTHNQADTTPDSTDASNWLSNCDNVNPSTKVSSGTWGPISHTYSAAFTGPITLCPIMYDPHGGHDNSGQSSVKDITAGSSPASKGYNNDNSYEANGTGPNGNMCPTITIPASKPGIRVVKFQRIGGSGSFTRAILTVTERQGHYVVYEIEYRIRVRNTGNEPLALSLDDPVCDAGTVHGPTLVSGSLHGDVLSPGGVAQYTCSHQYRQGDSASLTNVATVTGRPPSGPPVRGTSQVTTKKRTVSPRPRFCRSRRTGRLVRWPRHTPKPRACRPRPVPHKPKHPRGFTG